MELVPDETLPRFRQEILRIGRCPEPVCRDGTPFRSVCKLLVPPVVELHGSLGCIAARAVHIHKQFPVPHRKLRVVFIREVILVEPVALCTYDLHRAVTRKAAL